MTDQASRPVIGRRTEATKPSEFLSWARAARWGDTCRYHRGQLASDRIGNVELVEISEAAQLLQERSYLVLSQSRRGSTGVTDYLAVRAQAGDPPRSVLNHVVTAIEYRALVGVWDYTENTDHRLSIRRAIRDAISAPNQNVADAMFAKFQANGWIEKKGPHMGYDLTDAAFALLA